MKIYNFEKIESVRSKSESDLFIGLAKTAEEANADHIAANIYWFDEDKPEEIDGDYVAYYTLHIKRVNKC